ncbi:neprilysin-4-like [Oppia nitens]|uniref:neprilysin-4-like n=1 Tax=Oppia nitens TaxID=1686743 RepID=UPI0023DA1CF5|nr:neprilysin-4-like [Oppia nitens]
MDFNVNPCNDFYQFACGKWQQDHPFPKYENGWNSFKKLMYAMRTDMRKILDNQPIEGISQIKPKAMQNIYKFYKSCINSAERDAHGFTSLIKVIESIGGWPSADVNWRESQLNVQDAFIKLIMLNLMEGASNLPLIDIQVVKDFKNTSNNIVYIGPIYSSSDSSELYTSTIYPSIKLNKNNHKTSQQFNYLEIHKLNDINSNADDRIIKQIKYIYGDKHPINETTISADNTAIGQLVATLSKEKSPPKAIDYWLQNYTQIVYTVDELHLISSYLNYETIVRQLVPSIRYDDKVIIPDINFAQKFAQILIETDKRTVSNLFTLSLVNYLIEYTTTGAINEFTDEKLDSPEILPNICYETLENLMPDLLGRLYISKLYENRSHSDMTQVIDKIHKSFIDTVGQTQWMDSYTRNEAILKATDISHHIAYPNWTMNDYLIDPYYKKYSNISIDNFFSSVISLLDGKQRQTFDDIHGIGYSVSQPIIPDYWPSNSATKVGAFYHFQNNAIYFPAGIAQYPFYLLDRPMTMNLGSIGMIIAHEMTHALDIQGSYYNYKGDLKNWWTDTSRNMFEDKTKCFIKQYNSFKYPDLNMTVNGELTLNENIADNGGIRIAYKALKHYQRIRPDSHKFKSLPGALNVYNEDQLFFISFANMWCSNILPDALKDSLNRDKHSPEPVRVNGSLANFEEFAQTFNCKSTDKMSRQPMDRCLVW